MPQARQLAASAATAAAWQRLLLAVSRSGSGLAGQASGSSSYSTSFGGLEKSLVGNSLNLVAQDQNVVDGRGVIAQP